MKKIALLLFIFLMASNSKGNNCGEWYREFRSWTGVYHRGTAYDGVGNTYVLGGRAYGNYGIELRKYDTCGIIMWIDTFVAPASVLGTGYGSVIKIGPSGNIYTIGDGDNKSRLLKYTPGGNLVWSLDLNHARNRDMFFSPNEDIFIGGSSSNQDTIYGSKIDSTGTLIWEKIIRTNSNMNSFKMTTSGKLVYSYSSPPLSNYFIQSLDTTGNIIFNTANPINNVTNMSTDFPAKIISWNIHDSLIVSDESSGVSITHHLNSLEIVNLKCDSQKNIYVLTENLLGPSSSWQIIKLDSTFTEIWRKTYNGSIGTNESYFMEMNLINDHSILITGAEQVGALPNNYSNLLTVIEINENGIEKQRLHYFTADSYQLRRTYTSIDSGGNIYVSLGVGCIQGEYYYTVRFCPLCSPNIQGQVYHDIDTNCIRDTSEAFLSNQMVLLLPDSFYYSTNAQGEYKFNRPFGNYQIDCLPGHYWRKVCPQSTFPVLLDSLNILSSGNDFAMDDTDNVIDISVSINLSRARPGEDITAQIIVQNVGTVPFAPTLKINIDPILTFLSSSIVANSITADTLIWNLATMQPGDLIPIQVLFRIDSSVVLSTFITETAIVEPVAMDYYESNNFDSAFSEVRGSFDPNEKEVYHNGSSSQILTVADSVLKYTIHFQNSGNDTARTVMIIDSINSGLDLGSLEMTGSSHPYTFSISGRTITWVFNSINLPDSGVNFEGSQGFVSYKLHLTNQLIPGTHLKNVAYIYFDYNPPVVTNITDNVYSGLISVEEISDGNIIIYPNPVMNQHQLEIVNSNIRKIRSIVIYDLFGNKIFMQDYLVSGEITLNTSKLAEGINIISITLENGERIMKKIIKL